MYDQYQISGIAVSYVPTFTNASELDVANHPSGTILPNIRSVIDYNDATPFANENALLQSNGIKWTRGNRIHRRYFKPRVAAPVYATALSFGYGAPSGRQPWLNTGDYNVPHYCLKVYIDAVAGGVATAWMYRVYVTYYFKFRGAR